MNSEKQSSPPIPQLRICIPDDIPALHAVRLSVHENQLSRPDRITSADYLEYLTVRGKGWLMQLGQEVCGFAVVDLTGHSVWALFVRPEHEHQGVGSTLQRVLLDWYFEQTDHPLRLGTAPHTRAADFYRKSGWREIGLRPDGELGFEMDAAGYRTGFLKRP